MAKNQFWRGSIFFSFFSLGETQLSCFQAGCLFLMADGCSAGKVSLSGTTFLGSSTMGATQCHTKFVDTYLWMASHSDSTTLTPLATF